MKINRALNLVIPIESDGGMIYLHSTPIGREIFEQFFLVMSKSFANIFGQGLGALSGPRVAYLMLKECAGADWANVKAGLVNEVIRLTNVAVTGPQGWESLPLYTLFERGDLDEDTRAEIEGELIFFTLVSRMNKREQVKTIMEVVGGLWGSELTALGFMDYLRSLPTSTPGVTTVTPVSSALV